MQAKDEERELSEDSSLGECSVCSELITVSFECEGIAN